MDKFIQAVAQFTSLSADSEKALVHILQPMQFPKGHILVKPDTVCNHVYFIEKGLTRTFYYKDAKDVTDWISDENSFAVSIISFLTRKPDRRGIEVLEASLLYAIDHDQLEELCRKYHDIEKMVRLLVSSGLVQLQRKFDDLHFATALQRYQTLMKDNPTFIRRIPLGMIASYLGITQETLSRIRKQI